MYLTDSGPFQETSLENKAGSLFLYRFDVQKLKCLSLRNLAYPTGLEIDEEEKYVLVCETG
jgi:sugar lactone lactonase YvrE